MYTDAGGCTAESTPTVVTVNPTPSAPTITASGSTTLCPGGTVDLTSSYATGNLWSTTETTQMITVNAAGGYTVTHTDANGCTSLASAPTVVTMSTAAALPVVEGFVDPTFVPTNWTYVDAGGADNWVRSGSVGIAPTAGNSMVFDNYTNNNSGFDDEVWVEALDFSGHVSCQLTFDVAYARYNDTYFDGLEVLVSTDCGSNFTSVYNKSGTVLATDPDQTGAYAPGNWRNETVDLSAYDLSLIHISEPTRPY